MNGMSKKTLVNTAKKAESLAADASQYASLEKWDDFERCTRTLARMLQPVVSKFDRMEGRIEDVVKGP